MPDRTIRIEVVVDSDGAVRKLKEFDGANETVRRGVEKTNPVIAELTNTLGRYATAAGALEAVRRTIEYADSIKTMSERAQVSVREIQRLSFAANQNGSDIGALTHSMGVLSDRISSADTGTLKSFKDLGVEFATIRRMDPYNQFLLTASAVKRVGDEAKQVELVRNLLGPGGIEMLPVMKADLDALGDSAERWHLIMDRDTVEGAARFESMWKAAIMGVEASIAHMLSNPLPGMGLAGLALNAGSGGGSSSGSDTPPTVGQPRGFSRLLPTGANSMTPDEATKAVDASFGALQQQMERAAEAYKKHLLDEHDALSKFIISTNQQRLEFTAQYYKDDFTMSTNALLQKRDLEIRASQEEFKEVTNRAIAKLAIEKSYEEQLRIMRLTSTDALLKEITQLELENDAKAKGMGQFGTLAADTEDPFKKQALQETNYGARMEALVAAQMKAAQLGQENEVKRIQAIRDSLDAQLFQRINELTYGMSTVGDRAAAAATSLQQLAAQFSSFDSGRTSPAVSQFGFSGQQGGQPSSSGFHGSATFESQRVTAFAGGGYVDRPTFALVGDGGEGEYIIPKSKMGGQTVIQIDARGAHFEDDAALQRLADKLAVVQAKRLGQGVQL